MEKASITSGKVIAAVIGLVLLTATAFVIGYGLKKGQNSAVK